MLRRGFFFALFLLLSLPAQAAVFYPHYFTLENGLQVVVVPNHLAPAVNQMVWYKVGSGDEIPGKTGLAHYLEHLMFRGTKTLKPGEFSKTIAAQGGTDNAFTSYDYTAYHETVAADRLAMIMQMEADRMENLQITPEIAAPELQVVLGERHERTDNDPHGRFGETLRQMLMPKFPYGTPVIGWRNEIEKLTVEDAKRFYEGHYAPNNAIVVISGDITPLEVERLAKETYGKVPRRTLSLRPDLSSPPDPMERRLVMNDAGIEQPQMQMSVVSPSYNTQKDKEAYAYEVLSEVLDGGEVGLLYKKLVIEKGLASGVSVGYDPDARGPSLFTISLSPRPGVKAEQLEDSLKGLLLTFAAKGFDPNIVAAAKGRLKRSAVFARDSLMMPGYAFGMALSTGHTVQDVEEWPQRIDAVMTKDVNAVMREFVANPRHIVASLLPDPKAAMAKPAKAAAPPVTHDAVIK